jgi:hypothetical protein
VKITWLDVQLRRHDLVKEPLTEEIVLEQRVKLIFALLNVLTCHVVNEEDQENQEYTAFLYDTDTDSELMIPRIKGMMEEPKFRGIKLPDLENPDAEKVTFLCILLLFDDETSSLHIFGIDLIFSLDFRLFGSYQKENSRESHHSQQISSSFFWYLPRKRFGRS